MGQDSKTASAFQRASVRVCAVVACLSTFTAWACGSGETVGGGGESSNKGDKSASTVQPTEPPPQESKAPPTAGGEPRTDPGAEAEVALATEPNLKVAFIGDTASKAGFRSVLALIKAERADVVLIQGDLTYDGERSRDWFGVIDSEINVLQPGSGAPLTIPYFVAKGNHDDEWPYTGQQLSQRMASWGVTPDDGDPQKRNYAFTYKGLKVVMVDDEETSPSRADYLAARLAGDNHVWKVCAWHKNMRATNVGAKGNEMPWAAYESCLSAGAIIAQAHSHTYSRSKTLTSAIQQTVAATCADAFSLCVAPGKTFFFDSSLGGKNTRPLDPFVSRRAYWASTFTGANGALFIEFHVDGDPRKARGYFKTTDGRIVDPPASSGQTSFTITRGL